jgi:hypothetical protein
MSHHRKSQWVTYALLAGVLVLAVAGLVLLAGYFSSRRDRAVEIPTQTALTAVAADRVAPDLAVLTLAGEDDERIVRAARDAGELETAYAGLAHSTLLPDSSRSGLWLLLANDLATQDPSRALTALGAAMDMAALAPQLGDLARADISLQSADGYASLGANSAAHLALAQAEAIGRYGLSLLPAQRRTILVRVVDALQKIGDADAALSLSGQLAEASRGPAVQVISPPLLLSSLRGSIVLPPEVAAAISQRQEAAANLAARWLAAEAEERAALATALGDALLAEDQARIDAYDRLGDLAEADRLALLHDQITWLSVKHRVARRGYGVSLVPGWEAQEDAIAQSLAAAYTDLINGYGRQLDTLDAASLDAARVELLRQGLLWSRLGLFPGDVGGELGTQLIEASEQLRLRQGETGLSISTSEEAGVPFFVLRGDRSPVEQAGAQSGG